MSNPSIRPPIPEKVYDTLSTMLENGRCANPDAVRRLLTDNRMETVYRELTKHKRNNYKATDAYLHQADNPLFPDRDDQILWFLGNAVSLWRSGRVYTLKEIEKARKDMETLEGLFHIANCPLRSIVEGIVPRIRGQVAAMEWHVAVPGSREPALSVYLACLAAAAQKMFGANLYRTVATVVNVALGRKDITAKEVRTAVDMLDGKKDRKGKSRKVKLFSIDD